MLSSIFVILDAESKSEISFFGRNVEKYPNLTNPIFKTQ